LSLALELLTVAQFLILVLGGIVVYYATKSYRKTKSGAMLFLAIGFAFVTLGAASAGVLYNLNSASTDALEVAIAAQAIFQVVGFLTIVYSLKGTKD
jgi:hypothetical protein